MSKKVYVITSGEYSSYHIVALYSTRKAAETHLKRSNEKLYVGDKSLDYECGDEYELEVWDLDKYDPDARQSYRVWMRKDGNSYSAEASGVSEEAGTRIRISYMPVSFDAPRAGLELCMTLSADTIEQAVKVVNEQRLYEIANNQWGIELPHNPNKVWVIDLSSDYKVLEGEAGKKGSIVQFFHARCGVVKARLTHDASYGRFYASEDTV